MAARNFGDTYIVKFLKRWMDNCDHPPHRLTTRRLAEASSPPQDAISYGLDIVINQVDIQFVNENELKAGL